MRAPTHLNPGTIAALLIIMVAAWLTPASHAALIENLALSPKAMSLGSAVTADPPGIESIHFNPAGLARMDGFQMHTSLWFGTEQVFGDVERPANYDSIANFTDPMIGTSTESEHIALYLPRHGFWRPHLKGIAAPTWGFSFRKPGSRYTFGNAFYITEAGAYDRSENGDQDAGRYQGKTVVVTRIVFLSPTVAWKINDELSFGATLALAHQAFAIDTDFRAPNTLVGILGQLQNAFCGDQNNNPLDVLLLGLCQGGPEGRLHPYKKVTNLNIQASAPVDPTFNIGLLWEPVDWFALGGVYQSGSTPRVTGSYTLTHEPMIPRFIQGLNSSLLGPIVGAILGLPQSVPMVEKGNVTMELPFPSHWQVGFKIKPVSRVQFSVDAMWSDWGKFDALVIDFDHQIELLKVARLLGEPDPAQLVFDRGYKSVIHYGYGLQIQATDRLQLRFGYEPRKTSIPKDRIDLLFPVPDTVVYGLGAGYKLDKKNELDFTAAYLYGKFHAPAESSSNLNRSNFLNLIYNPYAGLDVDGGIKVRYGGFTWRYKF